MTTSAAAAAEPADSCQCAPPSSRAWAFAFVLLKTCNVWPARCRCPAMLRPMTPVPMNAIESGDDMLHFRGEFRREFKPEILARVRKADVLHHSAHKRHIRGDLAAVHVRSEKVAKHAAEVLMPRVADKAPRIGQHPDEAAQKAQVGQGIDLPFHQILLVEKPPAASKLELARDRAVLEIADHRCEGVIIDRIYIVEDRPGKLVRGIERVQ